MALPAGRLRVPLSKLLASAGLPVDDYAMGSRSYVAGGKKPNGIRLRIFREQDIPIQIALGNYDLGVCGLAWVEDLLLRYPSDALVPVRDLGLDLCSVYVASGDDRGLDEWASRQNVRIVSEYPGLAEAFARRLRMPSYKVIAVWGAAAGYPPEDADLAVIAARDHDSVRRQGLRPMHRLLEGSAWLVANRKSVASKDLREVMAPLLSLAGRGNARPKLSFSKAAPISKVACEETRVRRDVVRLAVPDGHQQKHAAAALKTSGVRLNGYDADQATSRPQPEMPGLEVKVIRPQDMPQQVALGHFDLAVTGRDWLLDHVRRFPSSPVVEALDLGVGRYSIAAVVSEDLPAGTLDEALSRWRGEGKTAIRIASEYVNVADHFARSCHFGRYKVIPIRGASEGFVPEDAELLIEGTETGTTLAANRLKVLERLFESTTCLIASTRPRDGKAGELKAKLIEMFARSAART